MSTAPDISLPRFEGPLDLLLSLVRKNQVDIANIPIAEITRQYLDYLHRADAPNIGLGSEFVYTAALLIHIKSRCLLAPDPVLAADEEDPRAELVRQLLDHDRVRRGAEFLKQKLELSEGSWSRSSEEEFRLATLGDSAEPHGMLNLLQVLRLAQQALAKARAYELVRPVESSHSLDAAVLLAEQPDVSHRSALFLAMLEMANVSRIHLEQQECFGPIAIATVIDGTPVP
jgi:segregation and condensation protein A